MGRLINADVLEKEFEKCKCDTSCCRLLVCPVYNQKIIEAIPKDQYETRLKADMVAMFEELQKEIDAMPCLYTDYSFYVKGFDVSNLIQEKINALKAESEE